MLSQVLKMQLAKVVVPLPFSYCEWCMYVYYYVWCMYVFIYTRTYGWMYSTFTWHGNDYYTKYSTLAIWFEGPQKAVLDKVMDPALEEVTTIWVESAYCMEKCTDIVQPLISTTACHSMNPTDINVLCLKSACSIVWWFSSINPPLTHTLTLLALSDTHAVACKKKKAQAL